MFSQKVYNKSVIDIVISSKKLGFALVADRSNLTRASHLFDPNCDSSESDFLDLITISINILFWLGLVIVRANYCLI